MASATLNATTLLGSLKTARISPTLHHGTSSTDHSNQNGDISQELLRNSLYLSHLASTCRAEEDTSEDDITDTTSKESCREIKKRRKQSKPSRLTSPKATVDMESDVQFDSEMSNPSGEGEDGPYACPHCQVSASSENSLRRHLIDEHIGRMLRDEQSPYQAAEESKNTPLNLSSPRWDTTMGPREEEQSPNPFLPHSIPVPPTFPDGKFSFPGLLPFGPPPFLLPFFQQQERERERGQQLPTSCTANGQPRIFNPEAFCDLCNKEFCNKYFLKTHKANKHGVYSPEVSNSSIGTPLGPTNPLTPSPISSNHLPPSPINTGPIAGSPYAGAFIAANVNGIPLRPLLPPHLQTPSKNSSSSTSSKSEHGNSSKQGTAINLEAYCELCQKEFCNKYFLKRHKAKIHGINIEVTIKPSTKSQPQVALDRPEGWCDACLKDIGSRAALNSHKLHVHGPHIISHLSPQVSSSNSSQSSSPKEQRNEDSDKKDIKDNFSPWDNHRENISSMSKENISMDTGELEHGEIRRDLLKMPWSMSQLFHNDKSYPEVSLHIQKEIRPWVSQKDNCHTSASYNFYADINNRESSGNLNYCSRSLNNSPNNNREEKQEDGFRDRIFKSEKHLNKENILKQPNEEQLKSLDIQRQFPDHNNDQAGKIDVKKQEDLSTVKEINNEDIPRTPGACSSTDESSRDTGIIAKVGQPAMAHAPPGAKFTPDQLRQLGVINPDAYCELCCKEFCNKYFLRTHRIKKHGIYTPEYSERSKFSKEPSVNLAEMLERQSAEFSQGLSVLENECETCRRSFPIPYLLQMHKYYFHGPGQEILQEQMRQNPLHHEQLRQLALQAQQNQIHQKYEHHELYEHQKHSEEQIKVHEHKVLEEQLRFHREQELRCLQSPVIHNNEETRQDKNKEEFKETSIYEQPIKEEPLQSEISSRHPKEICTESDTSEDLRKLQSMILELNKQGESDMKCTFCQKEFANKYVLRAHMMSEHGAFPNENINGPIEMPNAPKTSKETSSNPSSPCTPNQNDSQAFCSLCKKDFFSKYILQQHLLSTHGIFSPSVSATSFMERIRAEVEGKDEKRPLISSRSYCEICNKELCNKYFMKTHMLKMHGLNIENCSTGGVTCDVCNKELCSKYFLKVHKQNSHGLVDESRDEEEIGDDGTETETCPLCSKKFKNLKWLRTHLTNDHGDTGKEKWKRIEHTLVAQESSSPQNFNCGLCGQQLADMASLQFHVINQHGVSQQDTVSVNEQPEDSNKAMQCSFCSFTCNNIAVLYAHEQTHMPMLQPIVSSPFLQSHPIQCPLCLQVLHSLELWQQHMLQHQLHGLLKPFLENEQQQSTSERSDRLNSLINQEPNNCNKTISSSRTCKWWRCSQCKKKFRTRAACLVHVLHEHNTREKNTWLGHYRTKRRLYKCRICGVVARKISDIKKHIGEFHGTRHSGVPTSYARPASSHANKKFVMQPFLLNRKFKDSDKKRKSHFVPSLVYLPVAKKLHHPVTVSFSLTPA